MTYTPEMMAAFNHVGRYLYEFSLMEEALNDCIGKALGIGKVQSDTIGVIVPLRKKIDMLNDAIYSQKKKDVVWRRRTSEIFKDLHRLSDIRNTISHQKFVSTEEKGVKFIEHNIAKKESSSILNETEWNSKQVDEKCDALVLIKNNLYMVKSDLDIVEIFSYSSLGNCTSAALAITDTAYLKVTPETLKSKIDKASSGPDPTHDPKVEGPSD